MFGKLAKNITEGLDVKGIIGTVFGDKTQKEANKLEFEKLESAIKERLITLADAEEQRMFELRKSAIEADSATNQAAFNFMTAEVTQSDNFTKRARPTVIYMGAFLMFMEVFCVRYIILQKMGIPESMVTYSNQVMSDIFNAWTIYGTAYGITRSTEKVFEKTSSGNGNIMDKVLNR